MGEEALRRSRAPARPTGFIVDPEPTAANPDQLPVGFARRFDPELGEAVVDVSCAACHTGQLVVDRGGKRTALRIDGGPAGPRLHDDDSSATSCPTLTASLASTYLNPLKFRRFGKKVLGEEGYAPREVAACTTTSARCSALSLKQGWNDGSKHLYPVEEGFGPDRRASPASANTVFADELDGAERLRSATRR